MTKNERKQVIIMIAVALAIVAIVFTVRSVKNGKEVKTEGTQNQAKQEEFVDKKEDGTKVNTSNKLKETKKLGNLEISDIRLTSQNGESYIKATVKNTGATKAGDEFVKITVVDKKGAEITSLQVYLSTIGAGEETILSSKSSCDFANAYDFKVSK